MNAQFIIWMNTWFNIWDGRSTDHSDGKSHGQIIFRRIFLQWKLKVKQTLWYSKMHSWCITRTFSDCLVSGKDSVVIAFDVDSSKDQWTWCHSHKQIIQMNHSTVRQHMNTFVSTKRKHLFVKLVVIIHVPSAFNVSIRCIPLSELLRVASNSRMKPLERNLRWYSFNRTAIHSWWALRLCVHRGRRRFRSSVQWRQSVDDGGMGGGRCFRAHPPDGAEHNRNMTGIVATSVHEDVLLNGKTFCLSEKWKNRIEKFTKDDLQYLLKERTISFLDSIYRNRSDFSSCSLINRIHVNSVTSVLRENNKIDRVAWIIFSVAKVEMNQQEKSHRSLCITDMYTISITEILWFTILIECCCINTRV